MLALGKLLTILEILMQKVVLALILALATARFADAVESSDFSRCVANSGAVMYSAWWCPYCFLELKEFDRKLVRADMKDHEKMRAFPFAKDCGGEKAGSLIPECAPKEARGVPYWTFNNVTLINEDGKPYRGGMFPLADIAKYSGCPLPKN